jgi:DNA-binding XRE family transcriptional regulator
MARNQRPKSAALQYVYDRYIAGDPKRLASVEEERENLDIACQIYELRTKAGLSQRELARRVRTSASAICRLEDADYKGHSLSMLRKIAAVFGQRIQVRFIPAKGKTVHA